MHDFPEKASNKATAYGDRGDAHSGFADPQAMANVNRTMADLSGDPVGRMIGGRLGYLLVPRFGSFDLDVVNSFATRVQQAVRDVDQGEPCGWIVDLRENGGGNMWAMLAGLGPIMGEGEVGAFVDANGERRVWSYRDGGARMTWKLPRRIDIAAA